MKLAVLLIGFGISRMVKDSTASERERSKTFDLTSFKGQAVRIQFHGTEDVSLQTSFFIDDTALNVTQ
jgi:hypothetical protein